MRQANTMKSQFTLHMHSLDVDKMLLMFYVDQKKKLPQVKKKRTGINCMRGECWHLHKIRKPSPLPPKSLGK